MAETFNEVRGRIAGLSRSRKPDDPEYVEARRTLRELSLIRYIERTAPGWPALRPEQRERVAAALLTAGGGAR